jgi:hypothetical protein
MSLRSLGRIALLASSVGVLVALSQDEPPSADGWRAFTANWTLGGEREQIESGASRPASVVHVKGTLALTSGAGGLREGFASDLIGFDDGDSLLVGRIVLVDDRADRIFCSVKAEPIGNGRKATATITGGTGRFASLEGEFTFSWQYVVDAGKGEIALRAVNVVGRTRKKAP